MTTGRLWRGNASEPILWNVGNALRYYHRDLGLRFDVVHVNPDEFAASGLPDDAAVFGVRIVPHAKVQPNHYWFGTEVTHET